MLEPALVTAAEAFAHTVRTIPDSAMTRDWPWRGVEADVRWACYRTYEELRGLTVTIAAERPASGRPATTAQRILAQFQAAYRDLKGLLLDATEADVERVPCEGEWPLRQVIAHIIAGERGFLSRTTYAVERARANDGRPARAPDEWIARYDQPADAPESFAGLVSRYDALHERALAELTGLSDADLDAHISWWYESDVRFQLFRFDAHLREHTIQADKVMETIKPRPGDGQRSARLIYQALGEAEGAALGAPGIAAAACAAIATTLEERRREIAAIASG